MEVGEIVGYSVGELPAALDRMESNIEMGEEARIRLCTQFLPTDDELENVYWGMLATSCHVSRPTTTIISGVPTTEFIIRKGSPAWQIIIPLILPVLTLGLITFGIMKIETIARALVPILLISIGGLIILAAVLAKPATKYIERGGKLPNLPATSKKALAAW